MTKGYWVVMLYQMVSLYSNHIVMYVSWMYASRHVFVECCAAYFMYKVGQHGCSLCSVEHSIWHEITKLSLAYKDEHKKWKYRKNHFNYLRLIYWIICLILNNCKFKYKWRLKYPYTFLRTWGSKSVLNNDMHNNPGSYSNFLCETRPQYNVHETRVRAPGTKTHRIS